MEGVLERLKSRRNRESTRANYLAIWRSFNVFLIKLDRKPDTWEERLSLFGAYLVNKGLQSSTIKSYFSAIKCILFDDGYECDGTKMLLNTLIKACKLANDRVKTRLPIQIRLMEILLFELQRIFDNQPYLELLYKTMVIVAYYGMFRVGELATGRHPVRAKDVHIGVNKNKMLFILYSSKTHGLESKPQKVKIQQQITEDGDSSFGKRLFCPFELARQYLSERGNYVSDTDPFFVYRNNEPVTPTQFRKILRLALRRVNLNDRLYDVQSLRIGRATDMVTVFNYSITDVKSAGRWTSNTVYKYIRSFQF